MAPQDDAPAHLLRQLVGDQPSRLSDRQQMFCRRLRVVARQLGSQHGARRVLAAHRVSDRTEVHGVPGSVGEADQGGAGIVDRRRERDQDTGAGVRGHGLGDRGQLAEA